MKRPYKIGVHMGSWVWKKVGDKCDFRVDIPTYNKLRAKTRNKTTFVDSIFPKVREK